MLLHSIQDSVGCQWTASHPWRSQGNPMKQLDISFFFVKVLTLSPHKAKKLASSTITNSCKRPKYRLGNFEKKTVTNNVVSGSSGCGDPLLWELGVRGLSTFAK